MRLKYAKDNERVHQSGSVYKNVADKDSEILDAYSQTVVSVVEKLSHSVVSIKIKQTVSAKTPTGILPYDMTGSGSGVVITPDGTNFLLELRNQDNNCKYSYMFFCLGFNYFRGIGIFEFIL